MSRYVVSLLCVLFVAGLCSATAAGCGDDASTGTGTQTGDSGTSLPDGSDQTSPPVTDSPLADGMLTNIGGPQNDGSLLADDLFLLDWGSQHADVVISEASVQVPSPGNEALLGLGSGDLIASPTNGGFLIRVWSVDEAEGSITIHGEPVEIFEAVLVGGLDTELDLTMGGTPLLNALTFDPVSLNTSLMLDGGTSVRLGGNLSFSPTAHLDFDAEDRSLDFSISGPLVGTLEVDVNARVSQSATLEVRLFEHKRSFVAGYVGLLPIILTATAYVDASVTSSAGLAGSLSMGVSQTVQVNEAVSYLGGRDPYPWQWTSGTTFDDPEPIEPTVTGEAEFSVTAAVTPGVSLTFYWSGVGVGTSLPIELEASVQSAAWDRWTCDSGVTFTLRGQLEALVPDFASVLAASWTFLDVEQRLIDFSATEEFQQNCCGNGAVSSNRPAAVTGLRGAEALGRCEVLQEPDSDNRVNIAIRDDGDADLGQRYERDVNGQPILVIESVREVVGNLTINVRQTAVRLPNLERVTGELTLVGVDVQGDDGAPSIELPLLREVGSALSITWAADPAALGSPRLDLSALAQLGTSPWVRCVGEICRTVNPSIEVHLLGTPPDIDLPALDFADGHGQVEVTCGEHQISHGGEVYTVYSGLEDNIETVVDVSFGALSSATAISLRNEYAEIQDGGSGLEYEVIPAFRDCWVELPVLEELTRFFYPPEYPPGDQFEAGNFTVRGDLGYDAPSLVLVEDTVRLALDTLPRATGDAADSVPSSYLSGLEVTAHLGVSAAAHYTGSNAATENVAGALGVVRFPSLREVDNLTIGGASMGALDLPQLETLGALSLVLDESLEALEMPKLTSLGRFTPYRYVVDTTYFYEESPFLDAPLLAEVTGTLHLNHNSGDLSYSLPALETAAVLEFTGPGFVGLDLPALSQASSLTVSDTLLSSAPVVPRGGTPASIGNVNFSGNPQLSVCAIRWLCEQITTENCHFSDGNLGCMGAEGCVSGVCR